MSGPFTIAVDATYEKCAICIIQGYSEEAVILKLFGFHHDGASDLLAKVYEVISRWPRATILFDEPPGFELEDRLKWAVPGAVTHKFLSTARKRQELYRQLLDRSWSGAISTEDYDVMGELARCTRYNDPSELADALSLAVHGLSTKYPPVCTGIEDQGGLF